MGWKRSRKSSEVVFPLRVSASGRYLVQSDGVTPFRLKCDAGWFSVCHASDADFTSYLSGIKSKGFNAFILMNIVHAGTSWPNLHEPADYYNNQPFLTANQLDTPNPAYFARVQSAISQAYSQNTAVMLFHTYAGYGGGTDGWEAVFTDTHNTNTVCFNWGVYLANTFNYPNVVWMHGGDHGLSGTALTRFQQIVAGIQSVSRSRIAGSEWDSPDSLVTDQAGFTYGTDAATSDMQLNWLYGAGPGANGHTFDTADRAWTNGTTLPVALGEAMYENAPYGNPSNNTRHAIRAGQHWAITSGAIGGVNMGAEFRWTWDASGNPLATITATGGVTADSAQGFLFWDSIAWTKLVPSGDATHSPHGAEHGGTGSASYCGRVLIVAGQGTGGSTITSCMASDGSWLVAYVPPTGTTGTLFNVDLRGLASANPTAKWVNPTNASDVRTIGTVSNTSASQAFTTPGDNGTGQNDWLLYIA